MERGTFVAYNILAKHDERYMPPQMGILAAEHRAAKTLKR
jgi:cytochrome c-type biogenesis protein CcmE